MIIIKTLCFYPLQLEFADDECRGIDSKLLLEKLVEACYAYDQAQSSWPDKSRCWRTGKKSAGRILDGLTWDEYPEVTP